MYRCLIATLGRDAPGVNSAIRAVTRIAHQRQGWKVYAARRGFPGLLQKNIRELEEREVRFILEKGGSLLGSTVMRIEMGDIETVRRIGGILQEFDLVVATGGLGSFSVLNQIYSSLNMGTTTLFIPASIENEFVFAGHPEAEIHAESVGADTAANTGIQIVDRLREQSYLNQTVFLVQCIGMKSNFLPISIGLSCGAHRIYLPEYPAVSSTQLAEIQKLFGKTFVPSTINTEELFDWTQELFGRLKKSYALVIIPSNVQVIEYSRKGEAGNEYEQMVRSLVRSDFSLLRLVDDLSLKYADQAGVQIRSVILDDLQRGGPPTMRDRLLGSLYGEAAVEEYLQIINSQDSRRYGNLNLLAVKDVFTSRWESFPREMVTPLFRERDARPGGLDPVPFYRQSLGLLSGYRKLAGLG